MFAKVWAAACLLLLCAANARAQECYAMEVDMKYNIPQGVFASNGGCVKGSVADGSGGKYCNPATRLTDTRAEGTFSSLAACCAEVESRTRVDPRNGRPMPEQANVKSSCLAYKKPSAGTSAPAPAPAPAPAATGKECYGLETDKDYKLLGVWATYGGCVKGREGKLAGRTTASCIPTDPLWGGNTVDGNVYHPSLENCCSEVSGRTGQSRDACLTYKKTQPGATPSGPPKDEACYGLEAYNDGKLLGIWGTYGGCVKGVKAGNVLQCVPSVKLADGLKVDETSYHVHLENCCSEVETRTGHKGVKEACMAQKKAAAAPSKPAAPAPVLTGGECYAVETDKSYKLLGIWATYGGCVKGREGKKPGSTMTTCIPTDPLWDGNTVDDRYHSRLATCCDEAASRTGHRGVKESCLAYKKATNPKP